MATLCECDRALPTFFCFSLQYKVPDENARKYVFPFTPELMRMEHTIPIRLKKNDFHIYMTFNKKSLHGFESIDDIESITLSQKRNRSNFSDEKYHIQKGWRLRYDTLEKQLKNLEINLKYEESEAIPFDIQRIERLNQRIEQCKKEIFQIKNDECEIEYCETITQTYTVLSKSTYGEIAMITSETYWIVPETVMIEFYWCIEGSTNQNTSENISHQSINTVAFTQTKVVQNKRMIPKLQHS